MKIVLTTCLIFGSFLVSNAQLLSYANLETTARGEKASTYQASDSSKYSLGEFIYFTGMKEPSTRLPYLRESVGQTKVRFHYVDGIDLRIERIKVVSGDDGKNKVQFTVLDKNTMLRYKLDVESALALNELRKVGDKSAISLIDYPSDSFGLQKSRDEISKEMLILSALEMKKFTRAYNSSLILTTTGVVASAFLAPTIDDGTFQSGMQVIGGILILGGAIKGVYARQHIGRSGAYLEASANGVRIRF